MPPSLSHMEFLAAMLTICHALLLLLLLLLPCAAAAAAAAAG
jgi:hypothetical protein